MKPSFYIVDDDLSIRRILNNIIEDHDLGYIIGESSNGNEALEDILSKKPDIALIDLLLPSVDGVEIVKRVTEKGLDTQIIMLSQVTSKDMVSKAYLSGVEYYINKPINVIEVVCIINKAIEKLKLKQALFMIGKTMEKRNINFFSSLDSKNDEKEDNTKENIINIFSELGILGHSGSNDLINIIEIILNERNEKGLAIHRYRISDKYKELIDKYEKNDGNLVSIKAIEQRIRRIIQLALENIASLGIEDYTSFKFEKYSTSLFDFKEVKVEMDYIRNKSQYRGKINVKKFIEGVISHLDS